MRRVLMFLCAAIVSAFPAAASGRNDHETARALQRAGEIQPLSPLLAEVERRWIGRIIEVELEQKRGRWVYEFTLLPPTGRLFEIYLDARTGDLVRTVGPVQERR
jgi:uncharacterized membrane protein YkoI